MKWSVTIGRIAGIPIKIHVTLFVVIVALGMFYGRNGDVVTSMLAVVLVTALVFGSVLVHELGHAWMARRCSVGTREIVLLPIGGAAILEDVETTPKQDFLIAVAGPATSLLLAFTAWAISKLSSGNALEQFATLNLILGIGNLIPAFPLDGGRILRAGLTRWMGRVRATTAAAKVARFIAVALVVTAFWEGDIWMGIIGVFIYAAATIEERSVIFRDILGSRRVGDVMTPIHRIFGVGDSLDTIADALRQDSSTPAVAVAFGEQLLGVLDREHVLEALKLGQAPITLRELLDRNVAVAKREQPLVELLAAMGKRRARVAVVIPDGDPRTDSEVPEPCGLVLIDTVVEVIQRGRQSEF